MESLHKSVIDALAKSISANVVVRFDSVGSAEDFLLRFPQYRDGLKGRPVYKTIPLVLTRGNAPAVAAARGVRSIYLDEQVRVALDSSVAAMGGGYLRDCGYTGAGVKVAVLDTGMVNHPNLPLPLVAEDFTATSNAIDTDGHGTHVTGTIASNHATYRGVAPGVDLLIGKVLSGEGIGVTSEIIAGIDWAVSQGAQIINLSLGSTGSSDGLDPLSETCNDAVDAGVVVVVSAGNEGPTAGTIGAPAAAEKVITVGAVSDDRTVASFSSRGPTADGRQKPDVMCVGVSVIAPYKDGLFSSLNGTSMAAPHVTGLAALILEARPELSPEAVKTLIVGAAASMGLDKNVQGAGFVTGQKLFQILGGGMTVRLSTGLRKMWASTTSLQAILQTGVIDIYDGEQPVNPDYPPVGTHVARITQGGKTFSPGSATGGLLITTLDDGTVSMSGTWTLKGQATGTARWFRWKGNAFDDGGVSTALPRIDGKVGVDLLLQDVAMTTTTQFNVQGFTLSFS